MLGLIIVLLSTLLSIITGITVLKLNWRRSANLLYGLTSVSYIILGVANFLSTKSVGGEKLLFARLVNVFTCIALVFTYYLVSSLVKKPDFLKRLQRSISISRTLVAAWTIAIAVLCLTPLVINRAEGTSVIFGPLILLFALHMSLFSIGTMGVLLAALVSHAASKQVRAQAKYLLVGFIPIVFLAPVTGVFLPAVKGDLRFIDLTPAYSAFFVVMISYAMIRHRLFDIRPYVVRATVYLMTSVLLSSIYIAPVVYVVGIVVLGFPFVLPKFLLAVVLATIAAYNFNHLRSWFDMRTSRIFFRDAYDSAALLGDLNRTLVSTIELNKVLHSSAELVTSNIKADYCLFLLNGSERVDSRIIGTHLKKLPDLDPQKIQTLTAHMQDNVVVTDYLPDELKQLRAYLVQSNIAMLISLNNKADNKGSSIGYMVLGYKKNGNEFTTQDVRTLQSIADVLVIAIQNALHFEEIQNFNVTLQRRINEATAQLRRTNAKLQALDETKDDFISMASHQLRTPLTSVKGYLSMVLEGDAGKLTALQRKMLDQAFVSSQRMVFLIADLLNVSRLKTGKFVIEPTKVNLAKIINDEVSQLKETAKNRSLTLTYEKPADFPMLMMDETKIRQVIMNFIDNAIYYTPEGGSITVRLTDKPDTIEFKVIDTGIGVPAREQPHLFTKFYRAGNARQARPDGTGLGLFMAKKVVIAQGGAVVFESKEGKGSTFGFIFSKNRIAGPETKSPLPATAVHR